MKAFTKSELQERMENWMDEARRLRNALEDIVLFNPHGLTGHEAMESLKHIAKSAAKNEPYSATNPLGIMND